MEIDLERAKRVVAQFGAAVTDARFILKPEPAGMLRVRAEDGTVELPIFWAAALFVVTIVFALASRSSPEERSGAPSRLIGRGPR